MDYLEFLTKAENRRNNLFPTLFSISDSTAVQRNVLCRCRRELSHEYLLFTCKNGLRLEPRTSTAKFARSPCTDPQNLTHGREMEDDNFNLTNLTTAHVPLNEEEEEKAEEAVY